MIPKLDMKCIKDELRKFGALSVRNVRMYITNFDIIIYNLKNGKPLDEF